VKTGNRAQVVLDDKTIFDGIIHERRISQSDRVECEITTYTYLIKYERYVVYRFYQAGTKAGEIIRDLGKLIDDEIPVNLSGVQDGDALLSPWRIENQAALKVMRSTARGINYWLRMKPCLSYLEFDGVDDCVNVGGMTALERDDSFTVEALVYIVGEEPGYQHIVDYRTDAYGEGTWFLRFSPKENNTIQFFVYGDVGDGTLSPEARAQYQVTTPGWYHVFAEYDKDYGKIRLYVDNVLRDEKTKLSAVYGTTTTGLSIGGYPEAKPSSPPKRLCSAYPHIHENALTS